ncbi:A disintegrin and metalloproteinase with thrombospondin motifs adt-1 isoform X1 [Hydra vulgaris]|uniref:A disintegrin and metalloproteinase with thrombospondin motifs adt-1 isoform X1 n=1 Tax=Hydra vulgaris TaxID=6087 RepID=UPI0032EA169E
MGDLLSVTDQQEHSYIVNQLRLIKASKEAQGINDTLHYWIGLNNYPMLRKFTWCDNTNTNFTNWDHGEPDNANYNNEACVKATYNGWSDSVCQEKLNFICKAKIVSWSEWSEWSTSNQYCIKTRTRSCNSNQWLSCSGQSVMMSSDILCKELSTTPFLLSTITAMTSMGFISNILLPSPSLISSVVFTPLYSPKYFFSSIIMEEFSTTNPILLLTSTSKSSLKYTLTKLFPTSSLQHSVVSASPYLLTDDIHNIIAEEKWAIWSECSVSCGLGIRRRYSLIKETAYLSQVENCNPINCSVDGMWGMWEETQCSKTCGGGVKKIYRSCNSPHPSFYGLHCIGINTYTDFCDSDTVCPVKGYWSSWSSWSLCNKLCEGGTRSRFRSCFNPIPKICGQDCNGNNLEFIDCSKSNCKSKNVAINLALTFLDEEFIEPYSSAASDPFLELRNKINEAIANLYKSKKVFSKFHVVVHSMENPA